jgi:hypothetical protein
MLVGLGRIPNMSDEHIPISVNAVETSVGLMTVRQYVPSSHNQIFNLHCLVTVVTVRTLVAIMVSTIILMDHVPALFTFGVVIPTVGTHSVVLRVTIDRIRVDFRVAVVTSDTTVLADCTVLLRVATAVLYPV